MRLPWNRMESELKQELAHHLHQLTAQYERQGHSHEEAMWMAKREFGGSEQVKERCRDERRWSALTGLWQDFGFALRQMRRSPGFTFTAVLILALGIAANVIAFAVLQAMVLRSIDVPHGDRVMTLSLTSVDYPVLAYPEVRDVRDDNTVFAAVAAEANQNFGVMAGGFTRLVLGYEVSGQYFEVLPVKPFMGRLLTRADDDHPGASEAAVISWPSWKGSFGADPNIVGKSIRINKHPYTIVGVTPEGFYGSERFLQPEIFVPMANQASLEGVSWLEQRHDKNVFSVVRLKDGVTVPQALAELKAIASRIRRQHPVEEEGLEFKLARTGLAGDFLGGPARAFLGGVMGLAGIILLAACANLGGLFAARTADRTREMAIRMAIGSGRWRILRQVLVEALVISILGGICACGLAWVALTALAVWHPPSDYPIRFSVVMPQPWLILPALLISMLAGLLFGTMPLRQIFTTDPNDAIKNCGSQTFAGRRWALRDLLLAAQIALCCLTITAAAVSLRGMQNVLTMDLGFNPQNAVLTKFDLAQSGYSADAADRFQRQFLEKVAHIPGVQMAAYADTTPTQAPNSTQIFSQQTTDLKPSNKAFSAYIFSVSPGYFAAAGTQLLAGRDISPFDTAKTPPVAVVNQTFARRLFHTEAALGRYFKRHPGVPIQIVGIVADGKYLSLSEDQKEASFFPISQQPSTATSLLVRCQGDSAEMTAAIRKLIRDLDPTIPIWASGSWRGLLAMSFFPAEVAAAALSIFGAFGLLLSIAGTFGLASYTVSKRARELSIRVALGAHGGQILHATLSRVIILLAGGSVIGLVLGVAASQILSAIVYQASAQDPLVLVSVAITMILTGCLAVAGPVRRVLRVDPATLLREQ